MRELPHHAGQYDSWQKASHHAVAGCVDCHLPSGFPGKYVAKALNGYHHSRAFTFQDFHEPIQITPRNAEILQENCLRCHEDLVHALVTGATTDRDAIRCVHCHQTVGHGEPAGLGGPDRGETDEREEIMSGRPAGEAVLPLRDRRRRGRRADGAGDRAPPEHPRAEDGGGEPLRAARR